MAKRSKFLGPLEAENTPLSTLIQEEPRSLRLLLPIALGNGTRPRGFVLATMRDDLEFEPAAGVAPVEIETALNNQHLIEIV